MEKVMETAEQIKMRARLRRLHVYHVKKTTGKTDKELAKEFGVSPSQINHLCRRVDFEMEGRNFKEERNQRQFQRNLAYLLPITEQIKELTKDEG
jgi:DNA-binding MurR/RpiR family transcriptional regulator